MPLHIIKREITNVECDAIVNAEGVYGKIYQEAGAQLAKEYEALSGLKAGEVAITQGYDLLSKYVIHTLAPSWQDGKCGERESLEACYDKVLALAKEYDCETVALPLISSGAYGYPKEDALAIAVDRIGAFLFGNEMTVYLTIADKEAYQIDEELLDDVVDYLEENLFPRRLRCYSAKIDNVKDSLEPCYSCDMDLDDEMSAPCKVSLESMLADMDDTFAVTLLKLIDLKGITEVECYKRANVSKQTWYKIMNEKNYKPSKNTVIAFAIALELTLEETRCLLATVGFALSRSSKFDVIIEYFLINREYNIFVINETLFQFDQVCLGV